MCFDDKNFIPNDEAEVFFKDFAKVLVISYNAVLKLTKNCFEEPLCIIEPFSIIAFLKNFNGQKQIQFCLVFFHWGYLGDLRLSINDVVSFILDVKAKCFYMLGHGWLKIHSLVSNFFKKNRRPVTVLDVNQFYMKFLVCDDL